MLVQVLNCHDQNAVTAYLVEQRVREAVQTTATGSFGHRCPRGGILENATEAAFDFRCELQSLAFTLEVVVAYGLGEFVIGGLEKVHLHEEHFFSIFSNTPVAGIAAM